MTINRWLYWILGVALMLIVLLFVRMHVAAGQSAPAVPKGDVEQGGFLAQAWCTECHSVQRETAGTGTFAPDFTVIAGRRSARWLRAYIQRPHVRMPAFEVERNQGDDLVAYIVSLKRR